LKKKKNSRHPFVVVGAFVMIPFLFVIPPLMGWLVGSWLDQKLFSFPFFKFLFIGIGLIVGVREVYKIIRQFGDFS